jgi:hypothetical protein
MELNLLQLSDAQREILLQIRSAEAEKKLEIQFSDPNADQGNLRRSIYLDGGIEMIRYLLMFDRQLIQEREAEKKALIDSNLSPTQAIQSLSPDTNNLDF